MKRTVSLILSLIMVIGICTSMPLTIISNAANQKCGDNLTWTYENNTLTISGTGDMWDFVPFDMTSDEGVAPWYYIRYDIYDIVIEEGVTSIGSNAIFGNFRDIKLPVSVVKMSEDAISYTYDMYEGVPCGFYTGTEEQFNAISKDNSGYASFAWHYETDTHTSGDWVYEDFYSCESGGYRYKYCICCNTELQSEYVTGHVFVNDVCKICSRDINNAFLDMLKFTLTPSEDSYSVKASNKDISGDLIIPDSYNGLPVTSIDYLGFQNCSGLTSVTIPYSVTDIGGCSFIGCTNLKDISLPDSIKYIGENVFYDTAIYNDTDNWENGVLYIGNHLVQVDCNVVSGEYYIKDGTITVASYALYGCNNLTTLVFPDSLRNIDYNALSGCKELSCIEVSENNNYFSYVDGVLYNGDFTEIVWYSLKNTQSDFTIVDTLKSLDFWVFYGNNYLDKIIVPFSSQLYSIGYSNDEVNNYEIEFGCNKEGLFSNIRVKNKIIVHDISSDWTIDEKATCTQPGIKSHHCKYCDVVTDETVIPELGHKNSDWIVVKEATCEQSGYSIIECTVCELEIERKSIYPTGHTFMEEFTIDKKATCTEEGSKSCHCVNCDEKTNVKSIPATGHTLSDWIVDQNATVNASGSKHRDCTQCDDYTETAVISQLKPATPKLSKVANTASGAQVTWDKVTGADSYIVYRRTYNAKTKAWGSWGRVASGVTSTSYVDKTVKSGTYYRYTVKAVNESGASGYNTSGIKTYFLSTPKVTSTANTNSGITIKWGKVSGATGYIVYRKTGNGKWTNLCKTTGISFTDKKATAGVTYRYTVKAYYGSYVSSYNSNGYAVRRLTTPKLSSATSNNEGVLLKWNKVTGATGYIVYRKASSGEWKAIATIKGNTKIKYLDETPRKGATYQYCVKAYYGTSRSANSNVIKLKCKY